MPEDKYGFNNALVIVDRLSKATWTAACRDTATAKDAARLYYEGLYRLYGLPEEIVSDRGPQFASSFTDELSRILGVKWKLSSLRYSQTVG